MKLSPNSLKIIFKTVVLYKSIKLYLILEIKLLNYKTQFERKYYVRK